MCKSCGNSKRKDTTSQPTSKRCTKGIQWQIKDLYCEWSKHNFKTPKNEQEVLAQDLWFNSNIKVPGKVCSPPQKGNEPESLGEEQEKLINKVHRTKDSVSKLIYSEIIDNRKKVDDKFRDKWERTLGIEISDELWSKNFGKITKITMSIKLRTFQYRLLNHTIITNKHLAKWNIKKYRKVYIL